MDQDLPQASHNVSVRHIRDGENDTTDILTSLFLFSMISLVDLYEGTLSASFCAVLLATCQQNLEPGSDFMRKAEEFSGVRMLMDVLVDLQRARMGFGCQENEYVSRNSFSRRENQLVISSRGENEKLKALSKWRTVSVIFKFLYKVRKYCREKKSISGQGVGRRDNQLVISSHRGNEKIRGFSRWRTVSRLFESVYRFRMAGEAKKNDAVPLIGLPVPWNQQEGHRLRGGPSDAVYGSFSMHHHQRSDKQLMICFRQEDKRLKAFNRWRTISLLFRFLFRVRRCCEETKNDNKVAVGDAYGASTENCIVKRKDNQLTMSSHQENDNMKVYNRWRTISLLFEFLSRVRQSCKETKESRPDPPYRPPVIKNWQKGKRLGHGASGSVYEAFTDNSFFFAIKEVQLDTEDPEKICHAEQEISLLSQLNHKNIVRYLGSQKDDSAFYIFLELVPQGSLHQLYNKYHLLDSQVSGYTRQILSGISYLHSKGVIHRDIKCANVLVDAHGSVKLADFGLAKATLSSIIKSSKGSPYWMAPEVVNPKSGGYDFAADIWSLGCTVLEMLTRKFPYSSLEPLQAMFQIGRGRPPPIPNTLSEDARDFIHKCLQVKPKDRPTATQLLQHPFITNNHHPA